MRQEELLQLPPDTLDIGKTLHLLTNSHTNPKRQRGQQTHSHPTSPKRQWAQTSPQETLDTGKTDPLLTNSHTNPKRQRGQQTHSSNMPKAPVNSDTPQNTHLRYWQNDHLVDQLLTQFAPQIPETHLPHSEDHILKTLQSMKSMEQEI